MKKLILIMQLVMLISLTGYAEDKKSENNTFACYDNSKSSLDGPKFEIVHTFGSSVFYRINKETGEVWVLNNDNAYVAKVEQSKYDTRNEGKTNYQIIIDKSDAYLLNINTGEVWVYKSNGFSYKNSRFELLKKK